MLAERLKEISSLREMNPYRLSKASGLSLAYIMRLLDGTSHRPSYDSLKKLADALQVEVKDLVGSGEYETLPLEDADELAAARQVAPLLEEINVQDVFGLLKKIGELSPEDQETVVHIIEDLHRRHVNARIKNTRAERPPTPDHARRPRVLGGAPPDDETTEIYYRTKPKPKDDSSTPG